MDTMTNTPTAERVAAMLTENTGTHILDSGGLGGRAWQRNQGMGTSSWQVEPRATLDKYGVTVSVFHYLTERLTYLPDVDAAFHEWARSSEWEREPWPACAEEWARLHGEGEPYSWNTYNFDGDTLSQVLQGVNYRDEATGDVLTLLQVHGGADVRGGYTAPRVFRVEVESAEVFPYDNTEWSVACASCDWGREYRSGDVMDRRGDFLGGYREVPDFYELSAGTDSPMCPECGGVLMADAPYCY